ncbi:MAG: YihY/virulence factor BrkB family protein [Treponema sp.]|nr:YihY/virulence factor BrkB family protein [Treponema sp.]
MKMRRKKKFTLTTFLQSLYLTWNFFCSNDLLSYASSCSFGFFLSMTPVILLCMTVLVRFLHASPETVALLLSKTGNFFEPWDMQETISRLTAVKTFSLFEVLVAIALIILARRFVACIIAGLAKIFGPEQKKRPVMTQVFILFVEALIVVFLSSFAFIFLSFTTISNLPFLSSVQNSFINIKNWILKLFDLLPYLLVFLMTFFSYRTGSRTKPGVLLSAAAAFGSMVSFWVFLKVAVSVVNLNAYNVIYGVFGNLMILLLAVWVFFAIFLFFAQWVFVFQFFDTLLLCELYILPSRDDTKFSSSVKRSLFIRPNNLLEKNQNVIDLKEGDCIYKQGEKGSDTYFVVRGSVKVQRQNHVAFVERGDFFGEEACILNEIRSEEAVAATDVKLVKISEEIFFTLLDKNPEVSRRALSKISTYFSRYYSQNE